MANEEGIDEEDEDYILEQAKLLSMQAEKQEDKGQDMDKFLDNEFVGQIVKDLDLDINDSELNDIMKEVGKKDEESKKKEEEDKKK